VHCTKCGNALRRITRKGFLQLKIYPVFGFYPWECPACRVRIMLKKQHERRTHRSRESSAS